MCELHCISIGQLGLHPLRRKDILNGERLLKGVFLLMSPTSGLGAALAQTLQSHWTGYRALKTLIPLCLCLCPVLLLGFFPVTSHLACLTCSYTSLKPHLKSLLLLVAAFINRCPLGSHSTQNPLSLLLL